MCLGRERLELRRLRMKCSQCSITGFETPLYRNNPKGELADWRCEKCLDHPPDTVTQTVSEIILKTGKEEKLKNVRKD